MVRSRPLESGRRLARACVVVVGCVYAVGCLGTAGCLPVRIVHVSPEERADELLEAARQAELTGDRRGAIAAYQDAVAIFPGRLDIWRRLARVTRPDERRGLLADVDPWGDVADTEPLLPVVQGLLFPAERARHFREAWRRDSSDASPLLDRSRVPLRSLAEWRSCAEILSELEPRSPALEFRTLWTWLQVGAVEQAQLYEQRDLGGWRPTAEAALALARGAADRALRLLEGRPGATEVGTAEGAVVALRAMLNGATIGTPDAGEARVQRLRVEWGSDPRVALVLAAFDARGGRTAQARSALSDLVRGGTLAPVPRVEAALALHELTPERSVRVNDALRGAIAWAVTLDALRRLEVALIAREMFADAAAVCASMIRQAPADTDVAAWKLRRRTLAEVEARFLRDHPELLLGRGSVAAIRSRFRQLEETEQKAVVVALCSHPDATRRVIGLQEIRERHLVPLPLVPDLSRDPDARVRGSWIALQVTDPAMRAAAIALGRADEDPYVRELAERLAER